MFLALPPDLIRLTAEHLDDASKLVCRFVCRRFRDLVYVPPWVKEDAYDQRTWFTGVLASEGYLNVLIWARSQGAPWGQFAYQEAAMNGHLNVIVWAHENIGQCNAYEIAGPAAAAGQIHVLEWTMAMYPEFRQEDSFNTVIFAAASDGQIRVLEWLQQQQVNLNETDCRAAASGMQLETLQWLRARGVPWNVSECIRSARYNHDDEMLAWINANLS